MEPLRFNTPVQQPNAADGPMCRLDAMPKNAKGATLAGTGAVSSAFVGFLVWNLNIILAGLGLGSVAIGNWMRPYRWYFVAVTTSLLAYSFYKTYRGGCVPPLRNKIILWVTAALSISMTVYTIIRPYLL